MSNEHDRSRTNRYQTSNRYEEEPLPPSENLPALPAPEFVSAPGGDAWRPRNMPAATVYQPLIGETRRGRRNAQQLVNDLTIGTAVATAGLQFNQALGRLEESAQDLEMVAQRRGQMPAKIERENLALGREVIRARAAFEAVVEEQADERVRRQRFRKIDSDDYELTRLTKEAERLEVEARIRAAEAQLSLAPEISKRRASAELHKIEAEMLRNEAAAEAERQRLEDERRARPGAKPSQPDDMPAALAAHYATERKVRESRTRAQELAEEIRQRAAAEGREPTDDEIEEIDALNDAAAGAEDTIRRGSAGDFEV